MLIIHPRKDDYPGLGVETKKKPKASTDFGSTPMSKRWSHRVALPVLIPVRVGRNRLEDQLRQSVEQLDIGIRLIPIGVLELGTPDGRVQSLQLLNQTVMEQHIPAVTLDHSVTSPTMSSFKFTCLPRAANIERANSSGKVVMC